MTRLFKSGSALVLVTSLLVGCDRSATTKTTETKSGPGGITTTTVEKTVESSGDNPPRNSQGEAIPPRNP